MKELGDYLRKVRISNGVSITEACEDLNFSTSQLENIEMGNVKAFKDVYELRNYVNNYAKYLGLDADTIVDEFNGFLFQHTSKISLDDIREAQNKKEELMNDKKIKSPYTLEYKEKVSVWPVFYITLIVFFLSLIIYLILSNMNKVPERTDELFNIVEKESLYEFTY